MITILLALGLLAALAPAIIKYCGPRGFYVLALGPAIALGWVVTHWPNNNEKINVETIHWVSQLQLDCVFRWDTLAALMSVLILGIGALVLCYCAEYFPIIHFRVTVFGGEMVAFAAAMFGLVTADNLLITYIFWEITTVLSFLLVGFFSTRASARRAATSALLVTTAGGLAMLVGIIILGEKAGTYLISEIVSQPPTGTSVSIAIILILVGALSKSAIVPFHFWLPGAMAAPTPVSAYLHAAAMVKAGVFLVGRFSPAFAELTAWKIPIIILGLFTMFLGALRALREYDLKLILAFGTVSQLGLIVTLIGIGEPAVTQAGLTLLVSHAMFKAALFMVVGIIDHSTGTRDIRRLARLGANHRILTLIAAVAAVSMAGLPPTIGFVGKESALAALWESESLGHFGPYLAVAVAGGAAVTLAYSLRFMWGAFGRKRRINPSSSVQKMHQPTRLFLCPPAFLAVGGLIFGCVSPAISPLFDPFLATLQAGKKLPEKLGLWHGFELATLLTFSAISCGIVLFVSLRNWPRPTSVYSPKLGNADRIYDAALRFADQISIGLTRTTQRGSLPYTQGIIIFTLIALSLISLSSGSRNTLSFRGFDTPVQIIVALAMIASAIATVMIRNRLASALTVGITGYGCGFLFAISGAPDLALTQFLVETLTLVIFVLVLRKLPAEAEPRHYTGARVIRVIIGLAFGFTLVIIGLFAAAARSATPLHFELPEIAYALGHGANTVNVLLVDIRAWDTLGEISVLLVAATGVASMVFINKRFGSAPRVTDELTAAIDQPIDRPMWLRGSNLRDPRHRSMVLEATTRLIFPTMMVLSLYFFYSGHNAPGGGFAGGLTMGLALVLRYLAGGRYELGEALPIDAGRILGAGLLLSTTTAASSLFLGTLPATSALLKFHLPIFGDVKLVSALFFDLGVYFIVVGLILDVLRSLGARLDSEPTTARRARLRKNPLADSAGRR